MCGRYSFAPKPQQLEARLLDAKRPELKISYNIAPTHQGYVIANDAPRSLQAMEWGLVPHWSADGKNNGKLINARSEGIEERPSFREPIQRRRCLVLADSFYEWRTEPGGRKIPYRIFLKNGDLLFIAGIWDEWKKMGETRRTFSIVTTPPNLEMSALHNRMPAILLTQTIQEHWLSSLPADEVLTMLRPIADGSLAMYRVSEKLNKPDYDEPDLHDALPEQPTLF